MLQPLHSDSWYRIAQQRPRLREHVAVHVHRYRKRLAYILKDELGGASHRLTGPSCSMLTLLDGNRTVDEAWRILVARMGATAPGQEEVLALLSRLHGTDMLASDIPPDSRELVDRGSRKKRQKWIGRLMNPMSITIPLWDPDRLLDALRPLGRHVFGWTGAILWLIVAINSIVVMGRHWDELMQTSTGALIAPENLPMLTAVFLVLKAAHEMAHGMAVKRFGGEVHEIGVMLIIFLPSPYVDASAASAFAGRWQRALVGAAGMIVELFIAGIALQLWAVLEPGLPRAICFNAMIVASVSTLVFNGNPLMRYDAYYILSDLIEIPNLGQRSNEFWGRQIDHLLLHTRPPAEAKSRREVFWLALYGPVSFVYRLVVMVGMALYVAAQYFIVGIVMGLWSLWSGLVLPTWKGIASLARRRRAATARQDIDRRLIIATAFITVGLFVIPLPHHTVAEGVVWLPDESIVRAGTDGFVISQHASSGTSVRKGDVLFELADPELATKIAGLEQQREGLATRYRVDLAGIEAGDRAHRAVSALALQQAEADLARERQRAQGLVAISQTSGRVTVPGKDLVGQFEKKGEVLAYVPDGSARIVRVTVSQDNIGLVRHAFLSASALLASDTRHSWPARIVREVPGGTRDLPSRALGEAGGGSSVTDPSDPNRQKLVNRRFQFDLALPANAPTGAVGAHVSIRFAHRWEPVAVQAWRRAKQLLLTTLNV